MVEGLLSAHNRGYKLIASLFGLTANFAFLWSAKLLIAPGRWLQFFAGAFKMARPVPEKRKVKND